MFFLKWKRVPGGRISIPIKNQKKSTDMTTTKKSIIAVFSALVCLTFASCGNSADHGHSHEGTHTHEDGSVHADHASDTVSPAQESFSVEENDTTAHGHSHEGHDHDNGHTHPHDSNHSHND